MKKSFFSPAYISLCDSFLTAIETQRSKNLHLVLQKLGISHSKYEQMVAKLDKDYNAMFGLCKRVSIPEIITVERAKELKIKMQERVMELWNSH